MLICFLKDGFPQYKALSLNFVFLSWRKFIYILVKLQMSWMLTMKTKKQNIFWIEQKSGNEEINIYVERGLKMQPPLISF